MRQVQLCGSLNIFGIAFLWDWDENWPFLVLWPLLVFQICWHIESSTLTASSFRIWNSLAGMTSPPLTLSVEMLHKVHLTSHSSMSGSRWVTTPLGIRMWIRSPQKCIGSQMSTWSIGNKREVKWGGRRRGRKKKAGREVFLGTLSGIVLERCWPVTTA